MKKMISFLSKRGVLILGLLAFAGSVVAIPFICGAVSSTVGAVFASIGSCFGGSIIFSGCFLGQAALNYSKENKELKAKNLTRQYSQDELKDMTSQLIDLTIQKKQKEEKKILKQTNFKVEDEQNLSL